ncbi:MAG: hypothetical protein SFU91_08100 [Chloroherpetonaceae bacterium]|nr:hypothetical protein [Chloroherpetonaceae bacterium]
MGIWGGDFFDNDAGSAAKAIFDVAIADGLNAADAAKEVLSELDTMAKDEGLGSVIYVALAALLLDQNALSEDIRLKAKESIATGAALKPWESSESAWFSDRKNKLNDLLSRL